ncbi:Tryptophan synthase beta subunit-like PLP-dependent enzyme [Phytophthora cactorum]|nr:Tryptophan synthase beta subunit-like PLP-dependent enzyme [Phytophthora cactorum]
MKLSKFAKHALTFAGPSPIQHMERLSKALGNKVQLYAKREDCNSGLAFGGNKTRKLEYIIPEAIEGATTRSCPSAENWVNYPPEEAPVYDNVGNIELSRILGADVRRDAAGFDIGIRPSWEEAMEGVKKAGGKPYPIPAGCSEHPKGGLGFVDFAEEVRQQEKELGFKFDYVVVCAVTGSTMAGMVVGFAADGRANKVIGIDASATPDKTREQVLRIAKNTAELYGLPNQGTLDAIRLCARTEGILTDPVYEGKSMDGMISMVRNGEFPEGSKVLYAHLGGAPALSAYSYLFKEG